MYQILYFYIDQSGPYLTQEDILVEFEKKHKNTPIVRVEAFTETDIVKQYNVEAIPTFIFVKDCAEVYRFSGAYSLEQLEKQVAVL